MGKAQKRKTDRHFSSIAAALRARALESAPLQLPRGITVAEGKKYRIEINVNTAYLAEQSDPASDRYVFAYTVKIANIGTISAQLISRHWIITDAEDKTQEVKGLGVVGEQPFLRPGESFEYTSGTALGTPVGKMGGSYQLVAEDGQKFDAEIPEFTLAMPRVLH
jgi:ApaG protein